MFISVGAVYLCWVLFIGCSLVLVGAVLLFISVWSCGAVVHDLCALKLYLLIVIFEV